MHTLAPTTPADQNSATESPSKCGQWLAAVFMTGFTCFWNAVVFVGLGSAIFDQFAGTCHSSGLTDGVCTNGICSQYSNDDGGDASRRRAQGEYDRTMADVERDSASCALSAPGDGCAVTSSEDCSFSTDPYMGVFISLFALPFIAAGFATAVMAVRLWVSVLPCCAPVAQVCNGSVGRLQLAKVTAALGISSFAIAWNAAIFMMLLPQIPPALDDSIGMGVFLCFFSIPFLGAGFFIGVQALVAWAEVCPCLNGVERYCPGTSVCRGQVAPDSESDNGSLKVVRATPAAAQVVVGAEQYDAGRASHAAAEYARIAEKGPDDTSVTEPLVAVV